MTETDSPLPLPFVTVNECSLNTKHLHDKISDVESTVNKVLKILQGNGDGGLIWKVNALMLRNQWVDKGVSVIISVLATLVTLYFAGVLHI